MSIDDNKRMDQLLELFIQPGWKLLMAEMREAYDVLVSTTHTLESEKAFYKRKGEIQKLGELLAFEDLTKLQATEDEIV